MVDSAEVFVKEFHNLKGTSLGEKQKNLFKLLHKNKSTGTIVFNITPQTYLESIFKTELLIYFKKTSDLADVVKSGNEALSVKILKQEWFVKEFFHNGNMPPEKLVNAFLPELSFSTRMKVLRKLAVVLKDGEYLSKIFYAVESRYGLFIATTLLPACNAETIEETMRNNKRLVLHPGQLREIYDKFPRLVCFYIEKIVSGNPNNNKIKNSFNSVLKYIVEKNYDDYYKLQKKYGFSVKIGRRLTKKITRIKKTDIIRDPVGFKFENLHRGALVRTLGPDFKFMLEKIFPKFPDEVNYYEISDLLKFCPENTQFTIFEQTFESATKETLINNVGVIKEDLLSKITDVTKREAFIEKINTNDVSEDTLISNLSIEKSVPKLKDKINKTFTYPERKDLLVLLIKTCKINNDLNALEEIGNYIIENHKNDDCNIRSHIIRTIQYDFNLTKLQPQHWAIVKELFIAKKIQGEYFSFLNEILLKFMEFNFENDKETYRMFIPCYMQIDRYYSSLLKERFIKNNLFIKGLLVDCYEFIPEVVQDHECIEDYDANLISAIYIWNKKHPCIELKNYPRLIQSVKSLLTNKKWFTFKIHHVINVKNFEKYHGEIVQLFWDNFETKGTPDLTIWFLKNFPESILKNFDTFVKNAFENYNFYKVKTRKKMWIVMRKYSHIGLPQKIVEFCCEKLKNGYKTNWRLLEALSILQSNNYIEIFNSFKPVSYKVDLRDKNTDKKLYNFQCKLIKGLKYFINSDLIILTIVNNCRGDFLRSALTPLYSLFYHTPENKLLDLSQHFSDESDNPLLRIHYLCLISQLSSLENNIQILRVEKEKSNNTIKCSIFKVAFNLFQRNTTHAFWDLVKDYAAYLIENDSASFECLLEPKYVSNEFWPEYIKLAWSLINNKTITNNLKIKLTNIIIGNSDKISLIEVQFYVTFIRQVFLINSEENYDEFIANVIIHHEQASQVIEIVFENLRKFKNENFQNQTETTMLTINTFFTCFDNVCLKQKQKLYNKKLTLNAFTQFWLETFTDTEMFLPNLRLKLLKIFVNLQQENNFESRLKSYAESVNDLLGNVVSELGACLLDNLTIGIMCSLKYFYETQNVSRENIQKNKDLITVKFVRYLLKISSFEVNCLIALKCMKEVITRVGEVRKIYEENFKTLRSVTIQSVIACVNSFEISFQL